MFKEVTHYPEEQLLEMYQLGLLYDKCHEIDDPKESPYYMSGDSYVKLGGWNFVKQRENRRWSYYIQVDE